MTTDLDLTEAVDAAARDWWSRTTRTSVGYDQLSAHDQHTARAFVRPIVTAAAPVVAAPAWDEGWIEGAIHDKPPGSDRLFAALDLHHTACNPYQQTSSR